jgi:hypothetical protein
MIKRVTFSAPGVGIIATAEGTIPQIQSTIIDWVKNGISGATITIEEVDQTNDETNVVRPEWGSAQWAETYSDDIPSYDEPGDYFDA